ncbi:hypothetical protein ACFVAJ_11220 [Agromyces sp. NPDC057679]|uniref:hypothetical protein n=1 Tax=Agromyces sp. NPDC057679 TaxID=3346207 RepID=UPI0036717FC9
MNIEALEQQLETAAGEAEAARAEAIALEQKIINGDQKVSMALVEAEESKARYADLKVKKIEREIESARVTARQEAIKAIRTEIETVEITDPEHFIGLLHDVEKAIIAFTTAAEERTARVYDWQTRLLALDVPTMGTTWEFPPDDQFGIAPYGHNYTGFYRVRIDDTTIGTIQAKYYLEAMFREPLAAQRVENLEHAIRTELGARPNKSK